MIIRTLFIAYVMNKGWFEKENLTYILKFVELIDLLLYNPIEA